ncbi:PREDICTED: leucine-rich repeat and fibronectin type III domain-containing protein 1-like protein, partial [Branchiostoma belcheri]|uniref:Leucine-rich repeat and fibronectin type III domain-containing protein 1-like protein n=1 Tax=Branchiostoma belcheri TaxID=7741 RepID=A0A6P4Y087_BRABE
MGGKLQHVLIFLLIILKEPNMPGANYSCEPSHCLKEPNMLDTSCAPSSCWCRRKGLTSIPPDLPPSIESLELRSNHITMIDPDTFKTLPKLRSLILSDNQITMIQVGTFQNLPNLQRLGLMGNKITIIKAKTFQNLPELRYLKLANNQITTIQKDSFQKLPTLERLDLNNNKITIIQAGAIQDLAGLKELYLFNNQIRTIQIDTFHKPETTPSSPLPVLIGSVFGPVAGIVLMGTIIVTVWYKKRTRNPPLGLNPNVVGGNTNAVISVSTSSHDNQYKTGQGQAQTNIQSPKAANLSDMLAALKPNAMHAGNETPNRNTTATEMTSGDDQTEQGQSQAITESNRNTTATEMTSGDDQYEDIDNPRVKTGRGQSQAITESNTNTTGIVMTSG